MQANEFYAKVRRRSSLTDNEQARRGTEAVITVLFSRIQHESAHNVIAQLPREIQEMWESGLFEHLRRTVSGVDRLDLPEFLETVRNEAQYADAKQADEVTRAVFITLREQISQGSSHAVGNQLPGDLRSYWEESSPEMEDRPPRGPLEMEAPVEYEPTEARPLGEAGLHAGPAEYPRKEMEGPADTTFYRSDEQLEKEVKDILDKSDEIDAQHIDVYVQTGNVTLKGMVRSHEQKHTAWRLASQAIAVGEVRDELHVEGEKG